MIELISVLKHAVECLASDVYILPASPVLMKVSGRMVNIIEGKTTPDECERFVKAAYELALHRSMDRLLESGDDDFSFSVQNMGRFRCNTYRQRNTLAAVLRIVPFGLPDLASLNIPKSVMDLYATRRGMILVTGPAGSGKSTTLACIIDRINKEFHDHIITIEDPIEYLHPHMLSIVSQREIQHDTLSYEHALRAALRQAPDVILLGEMRDYETIHTALTAAETGHLLLSTLHTVGAAKTIDRIIDVFPANQQQQVRIQLSMVLQAVVSQQLIPSIGGGVVAAFEVMVVNNAIQNMIREGKVHQMDNVIYGGAAQGMITMDGDIQRLYNEKKISRENAILYATNPDILAKKLV